MDYSDVLFFSFPTSKGRRKGNGGEMVEKAVFYNFFNSTYPEINKKIDFRGSAFPFPPLLALEDGKKKRK